MCCHVVGIGDSSWSKLGLEACHDDTRMATNSATAGMILNRVFGLGWVGWELPVGIWFQAWIIRAAMFPFSVNHEPSV